MVRFQRTIGEYLFGNRQVNCAGSAGHIVSSDNNETQSAAADVSGDLREKRPVLGNGGYFVESKRDSLVDGRVN
ncbi:MAG: hypothetical protein F4125_07465, partial [Acidimicrobiaceae bacterium]|nr:hypothetical protein [Acidimicrobiaceae bacterium]